jgi:hypothetical protein
MAPSVGAVDGKHHAMPHSVDGMPFHPCHSGMYDLLWDLARRSHCAVPKDEEPGA